MRLSAQCSSCKYPLTVPQSLAGRKVKCPRCSNTVQLPSLTLVSRFQTYCYTCRRFFLLDEKHQDKLIACPSCHTPMLAIPHEASTGTPVAKAEKQEHPVHRRRVRKSRPTKNPQGKPFWRRSKKDQKTIRAKVDALEARASLFRGLKSHGEDYEDSQASNIGSRDSDTPNAEGEQSDYLLTPGYRDPVILRTPSGWHEYYWNLSFGFLFLFWSMILFESAFRFQAGSWPFSSMQSNNAGITAVVVCFTALFLAADNTLWIASFVDDADCGWAFTFIPLYRPWFAVARWSEFRIIATCYLITGVACFFCWVPYFLSQSQLDWFSRIWSP